MRTFRYVIADVFTDVPLAGNQLAVFTDARDLDTLTMQALAHELGFSESVFVLPPAEGGHVRIRIFTPRNELPFAGHPTLGSAFVLGAPLQLDVIRLETGRGIIPVALERDESGRIVFGRMTQPVPTVAPFEQAGELPAALGVERSQLPVETYDNGVEHVYVALESEDEVAALRPDDKALGAFGIVGANAFAGSGTQWKTRMFSPLDGVGEDAATGSAAGAARLPPRPARTRPVGRADRDLAGRRDRAALDALRACCGRERRDRDGRGRRLGGHGRPRRVQAPLARLVALSN
jgi:trans-2,3-dihydro-3-hydroxyanthranilate isomerase